MNIENLGVKQSSVDKNIQRKQQIDMNEEKLQQTTQLVDMKVTPQKDTTLSKWGNLIEDFGKVGAEYANQQSEESEKQFREEALIDYHKKDGKIKSEEELRKSTNFKVFGNYSDYEETFNNLKYNSSSDKSLLNLQNKLITEKKSDTDSIKVIKEHFSEMKTQLTKDRSKGLTDTEYSTRLVSLSNKENELIGSYNSGSAKKKVKERNKIIQSGFKAGLSDKEINDRLSMKNFNDKQIEAGEIENQRSMWENNKWISDNNDELIKEEDEIIKNNPIGSSNAIQDFYNNKITKMYKDNLELPEGHKDKLSIDEMTARENNFISRKESSLNQTQSEEQTKINENSLYQIKNYNSKNNYSSTTNKDSIEEQMMSLDGFKMNGKTSDSTKAFVKDFRESNQNPNNIEETNNAINNLKELLKTTSFNGKKTSITDGTDIKNDISKLNIKLKNLKKDEEVKKTAIDRQNDSKKLTVNLTKLVDYKNSKQKKIFGDLLNKKLTGEDKEVLTDAFNKNMNISDEEFIKLVKAVKKDGKEPTSSDLTIYRKVLLEDQSKKTVDFYITNGLDFKNIPGNLKSSAQNYMKEQQTTFLKNMLDPTKTLSASELNYELSHNNKRFEFMDFNSNGRNTKDLSNSETMTKNSFLRMKIGTEDFNKVADKMELLEKTGNGMFRDEELNPFDLKNILMLNDDTLESKKAYEESFELFNNRQTAVYDKFDEGLSSIKLKGDKDFKNYSVKDWQDNIFNGYNQKTKETFSDYIMYEYSKGRISNLSDKDSIIKSIKKFGEEYEFGFNKSDYRTKNDKIQILPKWTTEDELEEVLDDISEEMGYNTFGTLYNTGGLVVESNPEFNGKGSIYLYKRVGENYDSHNPMIISGKEQLNNYVYNLKVKKKLKIKKKKEEFDSLSVSEQTRELDKKKEKRTR